MECPSEAAHGVARFYQLDPQPDGAVDSLTRAEGGNSRVHLDGSRPHFGRSRRFLRGGRHPVCVWRCACGSQWHPDQLWSPGCKSSRLLDSLCPGDLRCLDRSTACRIAIALRLLSPRERQAGLRRRRSFLPSGGGGAGLRDLASNFDTLPDTIQEAPATEASVR
jgi:hypothetical protein